MLQRKKVDLWQVGSGMSEWGKGQVEFSDNHWFPSKVIFEQNLKELREFSGYMWGEGESVSTIVAKEHEEESGWGEIT